MALACEALLSPSLEFAADVLISVSQRPPSDSAPSGSDFAPILRHLSDLQPAFSRGLKPLSLEIC